MAAGEMFGKVVRQVFSPWLPLHIKIFCLTWSITQKKHILIDLEHCFLILSLAIPVAVLLQQSTGVEVCLCPIY